MRPTKWTWMVLAIMAAGLFLPITASEDPSVGHPCDDPARATAAAIARQALYARASAPEWRERVVDFGLAAANNDRNAGWDGKGEIAALDQIAGTPEWSSTDDGTVDVAVFTAATTAKPPVPPSWWTLRVRLSCTNGVVTVSGWPALVNGPTPITAQPEEQAEASPTPQRAITAELRPVIEEFLASWAAGDAQAVRNASTTTADIPAPLGAEVKVSRTTDLAVWPDGAGAAGTITAQLIMPGGAGITFQWLFGAETDADGEWKINRFGR